MLPIIRVFGAQQLNSAKCLDELRLIKKDTEFVQKTVSELCRERKLSSDLAKVVQCIEIILPHNMKVISRFSRKKSVEDHHQAFLSTVTYSYLR